MPKKKERKRERGRDLLSKLAEGRELSNPGETQWQREIKRKMDGGWGQNKREGEQGKNKTQIKTMFKTEVVIDN